MFGKYIGDSDSVIVYPTFEEFSANTPVVINIFGVVTNNFLGELNKTELGKHINTKTLLEYYKSVFEKDNVYLVDVEQVYNIPDAIISAFFQIPDTREKLMQYQFNDSMNFVISQLEIDIYNGQKGKEVIIGGKCDFSDNRLSPKPYNEHKKIVERMQRLVTIDNIIKDVKCSAISTL